MVVTRHCKSLSEYFSMLSDILKLCFLFFVFVPISIATHLLISSIFFWVIANSFHTRTIEPYSMTHYVLVSVFYSVMLNNLECSDCTFSQTQRHIRFQFFSRPNCLSSLNVPFLWKDIQNISNFIFCQLLFVLISELLQSWQQVELIYFVLGTHFTMREENGCLILNRNSGNTCKYWIR